MPDHAHALRLLVIEDSMVDAALLQGLLADEFSAAECVCVSTLAEATPHLAWADAVVLDLILPDATPEESIAWIPTCPKPVVVHSGNTDRATVEAAANAGALNYVCKGSSVQQMVVGVEFAMAEHRRVSERRQRRDYHIRDLLEKLELAKSADIGETKDGDRSTH